MPGMIGDGYFQLRAQIGTSLFSLAKLARELDATDATLHSLAELQECLRDPFHFVALGPSGSGKSALLNALFGREFAGQPEFSDKAVVYRHGSQPHDLALTEQLVEARRAHIFLRDFVVVDMPGLNSGALPEDVLARFLPSADLVLFVFPVKGDASEAWDFLTRMGRENLRRYLFVVQRCDSVSPDELLLITKRLRHTMLSRLGQACPIFMASAQTRGGLEKLERYIDGEVISSPERCEKLVGLCREAKRQLGQLSSGQNAAAIALNAERNSIEHERLVLGERKDESLQYASSEMWTLAQIFEAASNRGEELLRRKITFTGLLREEPEWWRVFQYEIEERLHQAIARGVELCLEHCEADLSHAWEHQDAISKDMGGEALLCFVHSSGVRLAAFRESLSDNDPDGATTEMVRERFKAVSKLYRWPALALLGASAVVVAGLVFFGFPPRAGALLALVLAAALFLVALQRGRILDAFRKAMAARREVVLAGVEAQLRADVERVYSELDASFPPLLDECARRYAALKPTLARVDQLAGMFERSIVEISERKLRRQPVETEAAETTSQSTPADGASQKADASPPAARS